MIYSNETKVEQIEKRALKFCRQDGEAGACEYAQYKAKYEQAKELLEKVVSRHEAGLLPDRFIYQEIKKFLDGTK